MSLSTTANTQDVKPEHESIVLHPANSLIFDNLPPVDFNSPDDDPPNVAIGHLPPRGTFNGSHCRPHGTSNSSHFCSPGTPKGSPFRPARTSDGSHLHPPSAFNGSHHGFNASPRTTVPANFVQQNSAVDSREAIAEMLSSMRQQQMCMRQQQVCIENMLTSVQQFLPAQGFNHGLVSPPPAVNNVGSPLCGNQHLGLVSPPSVVHKSVLPEDNLFHETPVVKSPNNVVGSPLTLQPSAAVPVS